MIPICTRRIAWLFFCLLAVSIPSLAQSQYARIVLSEICPLNTTLADEDGEFHGWIELFNAGRTEVDLTGWHLSDSAENPGRWPIPSHVLKPNEYLLVFASGKNRQNPPLALHTDFQLPEKNGWVGLFNPEASLVSSFANYPAVPANYSFGRSMEHKSYVPLGSNTDGKIHIPTSGALGNDWITHPSFNDADWKSVKNGIGFAPAKVDPQILADSVIDFGGKQGEKNWFYGYYNRTMDTNGVYESAEFIPFPNNGTYGANNYWNGTAWVWPGEPPPWTRIEATTVNLCALNSLAGDPVEAREHWPIRRWQCPADGSYRVQIQVRKSDIRTGDSGDGTTTYVFRNGTLLFSRGLYAKDAFGFDHRIEINDAKAGDFIDFAISPMGPDTLLANDGYDSTYMTAQIQSLKPITNEFSTDVSGEMKNKSASIYYRLPFQFNPESQPTSVQLKFKYDDGFVAHLNGQRIASRNAPMLKTAGLVVNSSNYFTGNQGEHGWFYGYYNRSLDADRSYQMADFIPFPRDPSEPFGPKNFWNGNFWKWPNGNPPYTEIQRNSTHPNAQTAQTHWTIRRWRSDFAGGLTIDTSAFAQREGAGANGLRFSVYQNGLYLNSVTVSNNNSNARTMSIPVPQVNIGDVFDFMVDPRGTNGVHGDSYDTCTYGIAITAHTGAADVAWNSSALFRQPDSQATEFWVLDLTKTPELLLSGSNILSIQGLNLNKDDADFLLLPVLEYRAIDIGSDEAVTFLEQTPRSLNKIAILPEPIEFKIVEYRLDSGTFIFTFESIPGSTYRVFYQDELAPNSWTEMQTLTAEFDRTSVSQPLGAELKQRFYRVELIDGL